MAGYSNYSKSNNAIEAEERGLMTASSLAAEIRAYYPNITASDISATLQPSEWHHTSCHYNETNYYNPLDFIDLYFRKKIKKIIAERIAKKSEYPKSLGIKKVEWLEWGGSRKHPIATTCTASTEIIQKTEKSFEFIVDNKKITKRAGTNGFIIY